MENLSLSKSEIHSNVLLQLKKYDNLSFLEQFALYLGVAQLFELTLKLFLINKWGYSLEELERKTLGQIASELKKNNIRDDFQILLDSVVKDRNHIAHEMLANQIIISSITKSSKRYSKENRNLNKAIYELEQIVFLFKWTEKNKGWD